GTQALHANYNATTGRLESIKDAANIPTSMQYDLDHLKETILDVNQLPSTLAFDERGNVTQTMDAAGQETNTHYLLNDLPDSVSQVMHNPNGPPTTLTTLFTFDNRGNV